MISKKALRICRGALNRGDCGSKCGIFSVCVVKNKDYRDKMVNLIDYTRDLNRFAEGVE